VERLEFSNGDIDGRIRTLQTNLGQEGFSGVVLSAESNLNYYADFRSHAPWTTFTRPSFLFVPVSGEPLLLVQTFLEEEAQATGKSCRVQNFQSLLGPQPEELARLMADLGMHQGKIGFELGFEQRIGFQVNTFMALKEELKGAVFGDASNLIWKQRMIKEPKEVECIRRACQATSYAHDHIFSEIRAGMTEFDISVLVQQKMLQGGAEYPGFVIITSGTGNYGRISKTSSNRVLEAGDYLWLDLGARYNGYWSDFCRSGEVGPLSPDRVSYQKAVHEVTMRAAESLKPGVPVSEVARACGRELERAGFAATFDCGRMGHGMGLMSTEPPSVTLYDDVILEPGMIINLEPGIVNERGVFDLEENYVITGSGAEVLSGGSRELHQISL